MKQTPPSQKESPLLEYAFSRLNPKVFSHPVWIRFGRQEDENVTSTIENLRDAAQNAQDDDPDTACQLMLACSVYQNYTNQRQSALETIRQVLALAKQAKLTRELIWANWGAAAICIQQGSYQQASTYLDELQTSLTGEGEWVLADFIDLVKQSLFHPAMPGTKLDGNTPANPLDYDLVHLTFSWIQQWGRESQSPKTGSRTQKNSFVRQLESSVSVSISPWRALVQYLRRIFTNKSNIHRVEKGISRPRKKLTAGKTSARSTLHLSPPDREIHGQPAEDKSIPTSSSLRKTDAPATIPTATSSISLEDGMTSERTDTIIPMTVQMLGTFSITIQDTPIKLHATRGLSLLKYLLFHHKQHTPREVLMDVFWPDSEPETARNNLNVAMHSLRRALRTTTFLPIIVFEDGAYGFDPLLQVWIDVEEFERCIKAGQHLEIQNQLSGAVTEYEIAVNLYRGDFLADTPYEGWTVLDRERLRIAYLDTLDHLSQIYFSQEHYAACATTCQLILNRDLCREDAHCRLMRCYSRLGQAPLALRQYQICVEALQSELEVDPAPETTQLFERIRRHEFI